jgi:hypothetical protein
MRTNVTFRHPADFVGGQKGGDGILAVRGAHWFASLLRRVPGLELDEDLCQEDWGVVFFARRNQKKFWVGLSAWDAEGAWVAHFHHASFAWLQWFSSTGKNELQRLLADFHNVLASEALVTGIAWHEESEMSKPEPPGFPTPVEGVVSPTFAPNFELEQASAFLSGKACLKMARARLNVNIQWYSIDRNVSVVDRGIATKEDAERIIDDYFARLKPSYDWLEDALAETMFGFQKSNNEFIEICIFTPEEISFFYEFLSPRKILFLEYSKVIQVEKTLGSKEQLKAAVLSFYDLDSELYRSYLDH